MDENRLHELSCKIGGRFRLAALIQKRLLELNRGQRQLVDRHHRNPLYTVLQEIEEDKLTLVDTPLQVRGEGGAAPSLESPFDEHSQL